MVNTVKYNFFFNAMISMRPAVLRRTLQSAWRSPPKGIWL